MYFRLNMLTLTVLLHSTWGILFKVFIVDEIIMVLPRFSLPDVSRHQLSSIGVLQLPGVSCVAASANNVDLHDAIAGEVTKDSSRHLSDSYWF